MIGYKKDLTPRSGDDLSTSSSLVLASVLLILSWLVSFIALPLVLFLVLVSCLVLDSYLCCDCLRDCLLDKTNCLLDKTKHVPQNKIKYMKLNHM
jgi:hypothetical protein